MSTAQRGERIDVDIRAIDRARPEETGFPESHEVEVAAWPVDRPWTPPPDLAEGLAWFGHVDPSMDSLRWVAWAGDRAVAVGGMGIPLTDNTDKAFLGVTVHPELRRRGVGTAVVRHLVDIARDRGRTVLVSGLGVPPAAGADHPSRAFARATGFTTANTEIERQLDVPVADDVLDPLADAARSRHADRYRIQVFHDGIPDALLPSFCVAQNRLNTDAPTGAIDFDEGSHTPEQYRSYLALSRQTGGHRIDALALTSDDEVAAYSTLFLPGSSPDLAWQGGTLVTAPHRGSRLGMAAKVANLRALAEHAPAVRRVLTENAEQNGYMVSINLALGFRVIAVQEMLLRDET